MKRFIFITLSLLLLSSCNFKQQSVSKLEKFTERIEQKSDSWSEADWDDALQNFDEIDASLDRYEFADSTEERYIADLKVRCILKFMEHYYAR